MTDPKPRLSVAEIMNPRSVAVIGASDDLRKFGARVLHNAIEGGFEGRLLPINPKRDTVQGLAARPSVKAATTNASGPIDVAVIAVPRPLVMASLGDCASAGVGAAIVITSGFSETGPEGAALQDEMVAVARAAGMRLMGPNCLGLLNTHARLILNSSPSMEVTPLRAGGIGFASQSGALMATVYNRGVGDGAGFSNAVSVGNQADLELADFIEFMADDPATRVVTLYVEGFRDPARFLAAARRCREAGKPVLMVKAGRSADGVRVARSHTASLAGDYAVLEAVCREAGVILVDDMGGLIQAAEMFSRHGSSKGDGVCVLSPSGGLAAVTADRMADRGLRLAEFGAETRRALEAIYVPEQLGNPLDLGALRKNSFTEVDDGGIAIAAADADVSAFLVAITTAPLLTDLTDRLAGATAEAGVPALFVTTPGSASDGGREALARRGMLAYETLDEALRVLACWTMPEPPDTVTPERPNALPDGDLFANLPPGVLGEHEVKRALARYGIPVTREEIAASADEAAVAATRIGYPVALKGVAPGLVHKSDIGAVRLHIADEDALRAAWDQIRSAVGAAFEGCLVSEMAAGGAEAILGVKHDAQFGPMLLFGLGGVFVELIGDVCLLPCPASPGRIIERARKLRLWPVFAGARGRPALDVDAFAHAASRLSWLAADAGPRLAELDVNPLIVGAEGSGVIAVDATATLA